MKSVAGVVALVLLHGVAASGAEPLGWIHPSERALFEPAPESLAERELHGWLGGARAWADPAGSAAQPAGELSADEAARQSSNPLGGDFMIALMQFDNYFMKGDITSGSRNETINTFAIQPVLPFKVPFLGEHWIWVNRPTFPIIMNADLPRVPNFSNLGPGGPPIIEPPSSLPGNIPFRDISGFGDIVYFSLLGVSLPREEAGGGDLVLAGGLTTQWPSASRKDLGSGKYSLGPSFVGAFIGKKFIVGGLYQQWISVGSAESGRDDVNFSWLNLFYFLNFPGGWQVGGTPVITADWKANSKNRWTVPLGLGVYKTGFVAGKLPIKLGVEFQWMPVQPDLYGQEFNIRVVVAPILPHPSKLFKK